MSAISPEQDSLFTIDKISTPWEGAVAKRINFERCFIPHPSKSRNVSPDMCTPETGFPKMHRAFGRALVFDPTMFDLRIYPFQELIHRSWRPGTKNFVRFSPTINLGTSLYDFIYDRGGPELNDLRGERAKEVRDQLDRCVFACNTLQTGFIRGNGFVIAQPVPGVDAKPSLICKPPDAPGMYDHSYVPLDGMYDVIYLAPNPRVEQLAISDNMPVQPIDDEGTLAICSPRILCNRKPLSAGEVPFHPNPKDPNDPESGKGTIGNQVNWNPATTCTSFTAFGITDDCQIVAVSMFEGAQIGDVSTNRGVLACEMGCLLAELGAVDGVLGGGSADTQQYMDADCRGMPRLLAAPPRPKRAEEAAKGEVEGPRGLGAIFAVLLKDA